LEENELISPRQFEGERVQQRFDPVSPKEHFHFCCRNCGEIIEFSDAAIDEIHSRFEEQYGAQVNQVSLVLYGICNQLQSLIKGLFMENCHTTSQPQLNGHRIALVGNPNVGKSLLFHRLTGRYVTVSNYPGTTVELSQGMASSVSDLVVIDTPGIIAFPPRTEDEQVTARVLLEGQFQAIVQVGDAKNLRRTLHLAVQLAEMNVPLLLALNMMDEAQARGLKVDIERLSSALGIRIFPTIATRVRVCMP
jgi:small GTP-binding protein